MIVRHSPPESALTKGDGPSRRSRTTAVVVAGSPPPVDDGGCPQIHARAVLEQARASHRGARPARGRSSITGGCSARVRPPALPDHLTAPTDPFAPTVPTAGQHWPSDPVTDLEHDREVLSWLQCSPQLASEVKGYLVDALLDWALTGRGYPQMTLPDAGPDCDHLQALQQIIERIPQRIAEAETVADKLELGRAGRLLSRAFWAAWDPQGVQDAIDRELIMAMPWLAGPPAPYEVSDEWPS